MKMLFRLQDDWPENVKELKPAKYDQNEIP
nr:hypothetical protein PB20LOC_00379 [Pectobacterium parmentieri]